MNAFFAPSSKAIAPCLTRRRGGHRDFVSEICRGSLKAH
jgi:hypothetical protein